MFAQAILTLDNPGSRPSVQHTIEGVPCTGVPNSPLLAPDDQVSTMGLRIRFPD